MTSDPRRENSLYYCLTPGCGGWLAVVINGGQALEVGGALIEHRCTLRCKRCQQLRVWYPVKARQAAA
jgi:hypothetical protein